MQTGDAPTPQAATQPFISKESVQAALNKLIHTTVQKPDANALEYLALVTERLDSPDWPAIENKRAYILQSLLVDLIAQEWRRQRAMFHLTSDWPADYDSVCHTIGEEGRHQHSRELLPWSTLFFRYVAVDFAIAPDDFAQLAHINDRTYRRYQQQALHRLTDLLIAAEIDARRRVRRRHLRQMIPGRVPSVYIGRDDALKRALHRLAHDDAPLIAVTGGVGSGKTAFLQVLLTRYLKKHTPDYLLWLDDPATPEAVWTALRQHLRLQGTEHDLRRFVQRFRVLLVIDGAEQVVQDEAGWPALLHALNTVSIVFASRLHRPLEIDVEHIVLRDLTPEEAHQFVASLQTRLQSGRDDSDRAGPELGVKLDQVLRLLGGNPLALQRSLSYFVVGKEAFLSQRILARLFDDLYAALPRQTLRLWTLFACAPERALTLSFVESLLGPCEDDILRLLDEHLLELVRDAGRDSAFLMRRAPSEYIGYLCGHQPEVRRDVTRFALRALRQGGSEPGADVAFLESLLAQRWVSVVLPRRRERLMRLFPAVMRYGQLTRWRTFFETRLTAAQRAMPETLLAYAACLRRLGERAKALSLLDELIATTGGTGDFHLQAHACFERAMLDRNRGAYRDALAWFGRALQGAGRYQDAPLECAVHQEWAYIALQNAEHDVALDHLAALDGFAEDATTALLRLQVRLMTGHLVTETVPWQRLQAAVDASHDPYVRVSFYHLLGRWHDARSERDAAYAAFNTALTLLEQLNDPFAIARTTNNMVATLLANPDGLAIAPETDDEGRSDLDEWYDLLIATQATQHELGDHVGLTATRHNLSLLNALIADLRTDA